MQEVPVRVRNKSKWVAVALAVFLGLVGAHKFYLGHPKLGILYITPQP